FGLSLPDALLLHLRLYVPRSLLIRATAAAETYTLALHDALPIFAAAGGFARMESFAFFVRIRHAPVPRFQVHRHHLGGRFAGPRSEEQRLNSSHVKISYAVFCLKKKSQDYEHKRTEPMSACLESS